MDRLRTMLGAFLLSRLRTARDLFQLATCPLFDERWYRREYQALELGRDAALHYLREGWLAGCDPGPEFQTDYYLGQNPNVWASGQNPLLHYLRGGWAEGRAAGPAAGAPGRLERRPLTRRVLAALRLAPRMVSAACAGPPPVLQRSERLLRRHRVETGDLPKLEGRPTILVCAHMSGQRLFGAERSLLDLLADLHALRLNVIVTLPSPNGAYEASVQRLCSAYHVFVYPQWSGSVPELLPLVDRFAGIIRENGVAVVHANTIMLREPLTAARRCGIVSVIHARELIDRNQPLARSIGGSPTEIIATVRSRADFLIVNSKATHACYGEACDRIWLVPNGVDADLFDIGNDVEAGSVRLGLIGSGGLGKGLDDLLALCRLCAEAGLSARFVLIGPDEQHVRSLVGRELPSNLEIAGYLDSPVEAIRRVNVLLSLSLSAESFGRSVAEAMAARRPVIAYDHGAVSELVEDRKTGFLVNPGQLSEVADRVAWLCASPGEIQTMGSRGRARVIALASRSLAREQLAACYGDILSGLEPLRVSSD